MKKLLCVFLTLLLLFTAMSGLTAHAATGSLAASASASSVTIGNNVTVTLKYSGGAPIASIDATVNYNAKAFEYVSAKGATANGGAGVVRLSYHAETVDAPKEVTVTLTFKAIAAGAGDFAVTTGEFISDTDYTSLGTPSKTLAVSAINPTKSANANLASIKPSSGTLTPKFSANVTNYTITVPYTTTSLSLSVTTQDKGAKTAVSGKNALAVGKNTQVITVTAPNGTTKKYTVVITRSANQTTTPNTSTTAPHAGEPTVDPLEVEVNGELYTVSDTQPSVTLPQGFEWTSITINNVTVSAAVNNTVAVTLVHLKSAADNTADFYIYDEAAEKFFTYCPLTVKTGDYILREFPVGLAAPKGAVVGKHTFGGIEREVFLFEDTAMSDIRLVYATSPAGKTGLYAYDVTDGSMQLYRAVSLPADTAPTVTEPQEAPAFGAFVTQNRTVILVCAAALGGLALLIVAVVLVVFITKRDKGGKH